MPRRLLRWRPRWSLTHVVMVVAGLLTFLLILGVLQDRNEVVEFAVLRTSLAEGARLQQDDVDLVAWNGAPDALVDLTLSRLAVDQAIESGWITTRGLSATTLLRKGDLASANVGTGRRLMSVPLDRSDALYGMVEAGDVVDVISYAGGRASFVVNAAEVVAVGGPAGPVGSGAALVVVVDESASLRLAWALGGTQIRIVKVSGATASAGDGAYPANGDDDAGS